MLSKEKQMELREALESSQRPLFLYDNDADGLCSFVLFWRFLQRGTGVPIRSYPALDEGYARLVTEHKADAVFLLDKPVVSPSFFEAVHALGVPVFWVDHHPHKGTAGSLVGQPPKKPTVRQESLILERLENRGFSQSFGSTSLTGSKNNPIDESGAPEYVSVYNWAEEGKTGEPVTYAAQKVCGRKEDAWIALMGCIADHYLPSDLVKDLAVNYPEFWSKDIKTPFDAYYKTELGRSARALNFGLKDSARHVMAMQDFLVQLKSPGDVLGERPNNEQFLATYKKLKKKYDILLEEALTTPSGKVLFFVYGGETSMSADLSNELSYRFPEKVVGVAYTKAGVVNVSLRGDNVHGLLMDLLPSFPGASGGGHRDAVGARIPAQELERFKKLLCEARA